MRFITVNRFIIIGGDIIIFALAYFLSYWLRFEDISPQYWLLIRQTILPVIFTKLFIFAFHGLYAGPWRYTGILDLTKIVKSLVISLLFILAGFAFIRHGIGFSRSVLLIDTLLTIVFISLFRLSIRIGYSRELLKGVISGILGQRLWLKSYSDNSKRILIYGAEPRGEMLLRSLITHQELAPYHVIGFIDDNPNNMRTIIHGVRHLGTTGELKDIIKRFNIQEFMIASTPGKGILKNIFLICRELGIPCRAIPPYLDMVHQRVGVSQLKELAIEDLLRRDTVKIDYSQVDGMIRGKRALITGAAGSIGHQLCKQILEFDPSELVCIDWGETPLFFLQQELEEFAPEINATYYCSNVTNRKKMASIFSSHRPQLVFHAAAHKHVPLMESNIDEVLFNNLAGTKNAGDMALEYGAEVFVFISSDKAVNPANVMGWTKRMGELYTTSLSGKTETRFLSVRFGNVLASNGSVVPIFRSQVEKGGPVKVTHKDVTRYFMTIPEAILLILQAAFLGKQGDTMILDMGEPVRIVELAEEIIRLAGFTPGGEIEITFTGLRHGEKMHEELLFPSEKQDKTSNPKISVLKKEDSKLTGIAELMDSILDICQESPEQAYELLRKEITEIPDLPQTSGGRP